PSHPSHPKRPAMRRHSGDQHIPANSRHFEERTMTYFESAEGIMVTRDRALKEIADHGLQDEIGTFIDDLGDREEYPAQDVLIWLGY
ncbi:MAG TPA: hypothetical protein VLA31_05135, partial [Burkholderiaceae bacterium]|nr:hypothetical protein [Burkholderiaceae bacterium]